MFDTLQEISKKHTPKNEYENSVTSYIETVAKGSSLIVAVSEKRDEMKKHSNIIKETQQIQMESNLREYVNANKTEYMHSKREGDVFTSSGEPLKIVDHFTWFGYNIWTNESVVNIHLDKARIFIDKLPTWSL